ncbi:MAG: hypothetical protein IJ237_12105 [Oscillospiraceae bacterium]|nr:hypothetical protein [Oscillospiraceae bacterium]
MDRTIAMKGKIENKLIQGSYPLHQHLLIMGRNTKGYPLEEITEMLYVVLNSDIEITIVCGTDRELFSRMESAYQGVENVHVFNDTADVLTLMDNADLLLTDMDQGVITEAVTRELPVIVLSTFGHLTYYINLLSEKGCVVMKGNEIDACKCCDEMLNNPEIIAQIKHSMRHLLREESTEGK